MVKGKESLDKEHRQETEQHPMDRLVDRAQLVVTVRQQVQEAHAQDHAGHEAQGDLHPPMRQAQKDRQPAAGQRAGEDQQAVQAEQRQSGIAREGLGERD